MDYNPAVPAWLTLPARPELRAGQVHLWLAELDQPDEQVRACSACLSPDELERAGRFVFERDRRRFRVSHGFLRQVLSAYLSQQPGSLAFTYGPHRKPALTSAGPVPLYFNLAHSQELALLGVTSTGEIGVDIEFQRQVKDREQVASHFFSSIETSSLLSLPEEQRLDGFFNAWTRKEAYLKALGDGLARPLDSFTVSLAPGEPPALLHVLGDPDEPARWRLLTFSPRTHYTAAVATTAAAPRLAYWLWQPPPL